MDNLPALPNDDVNQLIAQAIDKAVPVEALEKLLTMRRELRAEYARERFNIAMASFQAQCPIIQKTKRVTTNSGVVAYRYAPIESIVAQVKHLLQQHGFSYSIDTVTSNDIVTAICTARHKDGHSESSSFTVPLSSGTQMMSATQVTAAALTFAKRYAFCNTFGILTGDEDNDATVKHDKVTQPQHTMITPWQIEELQTLCVTTNVQLISLLHMCSVDSVEKLTLAQADSFIAQAKRYRDRLQATNNKGGDV